MGTPNKVVIEFQEFMKMYEEEWEDECREAKRKELREREARLEENRKTAESEMEERRQMLQQTRDMLAGMDTVFKSGWAAMKCDDDDTATRQHAVAANTKGSPTAAARRNDDETADKGNDTMAAARQDDDEMRDRRSNMTTEGDNNTTTAGTMEKSAEERWRPPCEQGGEIPRDKMMTRAERNTEIGTQTNVTREEEDLKRAAEDRWNNPRRGETNWEEQTTTGDNQGTGA